MMTTGNSRASVSIIIPTLNGAATLPELLRMLTRQTRRWDELLVVDSSSDDATVSLARESGAEVTVIPREEFDHGGTRSRISGRARGELLVFLTQDAIPASDDALEQLLAPLESDATVVAAYGRQLPAPGATVFAAHLRDFNYPPRSEVRGFEDRNRFGLKTVFVSNSFAAYRKGPLAEVGYFKNGLIFGEDTCTVGKLLQKGGRIAYVAEACVYHSHNYNLVQEFKRSFDIGVLHSSEKWLLQTYGRAEGHGMRYLLSEIKLLRRRGKLFLLPSCLLRNGLKYLGYRLGRHYAVIPALLVVRLSMHAGWWRGNGRLQS
ncbi:MAG: glycosyltransferase [Desulfobulbaceae bacterium]